MYDSPNSNGNSLPGEAKPPIQDPRSVGDYGRQIYQDADALAAAVREATDGAQRYLTEQVEQRPFRTLGVAAGFGYVVGGGLSARVAVLILGAATRLATAVVARELGTRLMQSEPSPARNKK